MHRLGCTDSENTDSDTPTRTSRMGAERGAPAPRSSHTRARSGARASKGATRAFEWSGFTLHVFVCVCMCMCVCVCVCV